MKNVQDGRGDKKSTFSFRLKSAGTEQPKKYMLDTLIGHYHPDYSTGVAIFTFGQVNTVVSAIQQDWLYFTGNVVLKNSRHIFVRAGLFQFCSRDLRTLEKENFTCGHYTDDFFSDYGYSLYVAFCQILCCFGWLCALFAFMINSYNVVAEEAKLFRISKYFILLAGVYQLASILTFIHAMFLVKQRVDKMIRGISIVFNTPLFIFAFSPLISVLGFAMIYRSPGLYQLDLGEVPEHELYAMPESLTDIFSESDNDHRRSFGNAFANIRKSIWGDRNSNQAPRDDVIGAKRK